MCRTIIIFTVCLFALSAFGQQRSVTGKVLDASTNAPLSNATVSVLGQSSRSTTTSENGSFSIPVTGRQTLVASYTGYTPATVSVAENQTSVSISLTRLETGLDEVVVIGYGTQKRKDITSAISSISAEQISEVPATNLNMAMQGRVPGLQITSGGNEPGAGSIALIRGINSINVSNGPLYVVDGVITSGDIRELNPDDIESIDVLKDASAAAIYGSRASEGVIIITTKRGRIGKAMINYHGYYGVQKAVKAFDFIDGKDYELLRRLAYYDESGNKMFLNDTTADKQYEKQIFSSLELQSIKDGKSYNWPDKVLQVAPTTSHTISVSNGNDKNRLYLSGNYLDQDGIIRNSNFKRYSITSNGESKITDRLKAIVNLNIAHTDNRILNQNVYYNALTISPLYPYTDAEGNNTVVLDPTKGSLYVINNPEIVTRNPRYRGTDRILGNLALEYDIIKDLKFRTSFGADVYSDKQTFYAPRNINVNNSYTLGGYGSIENFNYRDFIAENTLNYRFKLGEDHDFSALAGFTFEKRRQEWNAMYGTGFPSDKTTFKDMSLASNKTMVSDFFNWAVQSQLARLIYNYKGRYIFNTSIRRDGVSYFGENNRFGVYPSFSAAWRLIDEPFMNDIKLKGSLSDLKLRVGYGLVGNYNRTYSSVYSKMSSSGYPFGTTAPTTGYQVDFGRLANKDLKWESQKQFNLGTDISLVSDRITINADFYKKSNENLLMDLELPSSSAYQYKTINVAAMSTTGFEFNINADIIKNSTFRWQVQLNYSTYKSKVTKIFPGVDSLRPNLKVGEAPNSLIIDYIYDGIYQMKDSIAAQAAGVKPGSVRIKDLDGNGVFNQYDMTTVGRTTPKGWGGIWSHWNYKGISLTVFANYMYGHSIFNKAYQDYLYSDGRRMVMKQGMNFWTETITDVYGNVVVEENTNTDVPRPNAFGNSVKTLPGGTSSFAVQKGDFVKIRNITLAYDFHQNVLNKLKANSLSVYIQFLDPFTLTNYKGVDPEISQVRSGSWSGGNYDIYPRYRTTLVGVKIGL